MRIIKPRAWDKRNNKMVEVTMILFDSEEIDYRGNLNEPVHWRHFEMMRPTGWEDKNGKSVYEGDTIEGNLFDRRLPIAGDVVYDEKHAQYALKNQAGLTPLYKIAEIVVIGNTYEQVTP